MCSMLLTITSNLFKPYLVIGRQQQPEGLQVADTEHAVLMFLGTKVAATTCRKPLW